MPSKITRHQFDAAARRQVTKKLPAGIGVHHLLCLLLWLTDPLSVGAKEYTLVVQPSANDCQHVQSVVQIRGDLKLNADGTAVKRIPINVSAHMTYLERTLEAESPARHAVRHYELAAADIQIGKTNLRAELRPVRSTLAAHWDGVARPRLYSPLGPLSQEEVDLVDVQGNSLCLDELVPTTPVKLSDAWDHAPSAMVALLNLDAVSKSDVRSTLVKVQNDLAVMDLAGKVDGVVGGVATEIELKGQWEFDLRRGRTTRLVASLRENRSIGHAEPGFEVLARIRTTIRPVDTIPQLEDSALTGLELAPTLANQLIWATSPATGIAFLHDRQWRVMADNPDGIVLRQVAGGELLAQCNLTPLGKLPDGQTLSLEQFQADVQRTLGDRLQQFLEASQTDEQGLRILRVVASGTVSDLAIRWIYYHVSNPAGRRASLVFTLEENLVEQFAESDRTLAESLELVEPALPGGK
ncbi:MAG: hypothetical protein J5I93_24155 [Pirellulaceae bacterium]|nr:hypothetical protein [Pirellulaceae bacterium]